MSSAPRSAVTKIPGIPSWFPLLPPPFSEPAISPPRLTADSTFGPGNPFYAASKLPFQAPPFDEIKDSDYQPAIDAGIAEERKEIQAIADNPAAPTFENTIVALEKSGTIVHYRVMAGIPTEVTVANLDPELQKVQDYEAPRETAALQDAIYLERQALPARRQTLSAARFAASSTPSRSACSISITRSLSTPARTSMTLTKRP